MSLFASRFEEPPAVWGVGRVVQDGVVTPWPVAEADIDDEADWIAGMLADLGLEPGGIVVVVALLSDAMHAVPIERAAGRLGALYSSADATASDAFRVDYLVRELAPAIVVGITGAVVAGLTDAGHEAGRVFAGVRTVLAGDGAGYHGLAAAGVVARRWLRLGPTSAFETEPGVARYDPDRWTVDASPSGTIAVSNRVARHTPARRWPTGVRATVESPGRLRLDL